MISHFNLCLTNIDFLRISLKKNATKPKGQKDYLDHKFQDYLVIKSNILSMCVNIII